MRLFRRRKHLLKESREAIARQERLRPAIDLQREEAADLSEWARERMRLNHLTAIFLHDRAAARRD